MGELTDKMKDTLNYCFDARLRELSRTKEALIENFVEIPVEIEDEIKCIEAIKELHNRKIGLFKH